jgi:diguanylate cyclase (GGDEF)-like protein
MKLHQSEASSEQNPSQTNSSAIVLLVDDQATVAKAIRLLLAEASDIGFHYCPDPLDAIKTANVVKPTVILQDLVMPSIDGLDVVQHFRANPATAQTPIIVLSSEESGSIKSRAFEVGANDYLVKLPDKVELIARIRYHSRAFLNQIQRDTAFKDLRESEKQLISVNQKLEETCDKLDVTLREAEQREHETIRLTELVDILQSCHTLEEAYEIAGSSLPMLLSAQAGALCITGSSRNIVDAVATWGDSVATLKTFAPENCWALRRGKIHVVTSPSSPLLCSHVRACPEAGYICVPLAAQGETLGVLYLERPSSSPNISKAQLQGPMEALSRQAVAAGERISLALANLSLREILRVQSVRDPLTGLFNRRYMEESLERELRRGSRNNQCVAVLMMDIDHFKRFNDTFGHQAGDTLLRSLGDFVRQRTRGQDIACRFGGEEFVIILASTSIDAACKRAERLREEMKDLNVEYAGRPLGKITLSIGISVFPVHATTTEELLLLADQALYRAKKEGRDKMVLASEVENVKVTTKVST